MAKITLSVPDDLYQKLEKYKERLNYSDIFRRAASEEIDKIEEKGELIEGLMDYLSGKLLKREDKEKVREAEVGRFTKKWGTPDYEENTEVELPYVNVSKTQKVNIGDQTIAELRISNSRVLASEVRERVEKRFGEYDINLYDKNLEPLVEYFKSKGFTIIEESLLQHDVMSYVLKTYGSEGRERARELGMKGYQYFGLFAADKEDLVFIAYREVKSK